MDMVSTADLRRKMQEVWGSRGLSMLEDALRELTPAGPVFLGRDRDGYQLWRLPNGGWIVGDEQDALEAIRDNAHGTSLNDYVKVNGPIQAPEPEPASEGKLNFVGYDRDGDLVWQLPNGSWTGGSPNNASVMAQTGEYDKSPATYLEMYGPITREPRA